MNSILTRNLKKKIICCIVGVIIYLSLQALSMTLLKDVYTFRWMADHLYCYTWIIVIVLIAFDQTLLSYCIIFGNLFGTIIGEVLGSFIKNQRMGNITTNMNIGEIEYRSLHHGVLIWLVTIILFIGAGIAAKKFTSKMAKK